MKVRARCLDCLAKSFVVDFEDRANARSVTAWAHAHVERMAGHAVVLQRKKTVSWDTITKIGDVPAHLRSV